MTYPYDWRKKVIVFPEQVKQLTRQRDGLEAMIEKFMGKIPNHCLDTEAFFEFSEAYENYLSEKGC